MSLSKRVRFEVFKRDLFTCRYCGQRPPDVVLHVDHILARAEGGGDGLDNLVTSCMACNLGKGAKGLGVTTPWVDEQEVLGSIQEMAERRLQMAAGVREAAAFRDAEDRAVELALGWLHNELGLDDGVASTRSVRRFIQRLGVQGVGDAVRVTAEAGERGTFEFQEHAWRYFCKVCWIWIKEADATNDPGDTQA